MVLREADFDAFEKTGLTLIKNGHFMGEDITEKIATLNIICCHPFLADKVMTEVVGCTADVRFNCDWYFPIRAA